MSGFEKVWGKLMFVDQLSFTGRLAPFRYDHPVRLSAAIFGKWLFTIFHRLGAVGASIGLVPSGQRAVAGFVLRYKRLVVRA